MTAQETFSTMMRSRIAPALRKLGLKGSGQTFQLPSDECWALLGFQRSQWSDAGHAKFTVNVTVASREAWERARAQRSYLNERPSPNTFYGTFVWQQRIGALMPGGEDCWWNVRGGAETSAVASAVVDAIREYALPAMRDEMRRVESNRSDIASLS